MKNNQLYIHYPFGYKLLPLLPTAHDFRQAASHASVEEIARVQERESVSSSDRNPGTGM